MLSLVNAYCIRSDLTAVRLLRYNGYVPLKYGPYSFNSILSHSSVCGPKSTSNKQRQITYKPFVKKCYKDHDHKNMTLKRPMSPHLEIYAPTLPAMTSIAQRITGLVLTFYAVMLSGGTLFLSNGVETYVTMIQSLDLSRISTFLAKVILGAPFAFHYFCGIRFCMWNSGRWLNMKDVYRSAKQAIVACAITTLLFAIL